MITLCAVDLNFVSQSLRGNSVNQIIKNILDKNISNKEKAKEIEDIKASIEVAEKIFSGEFTYCMKCGDYFLTEGFITRTEVVTERVCTYSDPINSGGDEYGNRKVRYTYLYCPKGCKHTTNREEFWID